MSPASRNSISARIAAFAPIFLSILIAAILLAPARPTQARFYARKLSGVLPAGASVEHMDFSTHEISPDSLRVVYVVRGDPAGSNDLYPVLIHGGSPVRLTLPGFSGRGI